MKLLYAIIISITLTNCSLIRENNVVKKPSFILPNKTINLNEYKQLSPFFVEDNICYSKDDYLKLLYLINDLKGYIEYQKALNSKIIKYYEE